MPPDLPSVLGYMCLCTCTQSFVPPPLFHKYSFCPPLDQFLSEGLTRHHVTCISPPNYCWDKLVCDKVLTNSQLYCVNRHNRQIRLCQHDRKQLKRIVLAKGTEYSMTCAGGVREYGILHDTASGRSLPPSLQTASCFHQTPQFQAQWYICIIY